MTQTFNYFSIQMEYISGNKIIECYSVYQVNLNVVVLKL